MIKCWPLLLFLRIQSNQIKRKSPNIQFQNYSVIERFFHIFLIQNYYIVLLTPLYFKPSLMPIKFIMKLTSFFAILTILSFLTITQQLDWQGYGNVSSSNLTDIWNLINIGLSTGLNNGTNTGFYNFTRFMSDGLNELWNPAWNVLFLSTAAGKDTILYGYAFRYDWMWYNGYRVQDKYLSFIIWKDYNCHNWVDVGQDHYAENLLGSQLKNAASIINKTNIDADIWGETKKFMDSLVQQSSFSGDKAFSIIVTQDYMQAAFFGRFCMLGTNYFLSHSADYILGNNAGQYILFQTR